MNLLFFIISFLASTLGAISGIGGGIIIKPVLDSFGVLEVTAISFLSGCTVLSMSTTNLLLSTKSAVKLKKNCSLQLAIGSCVGGIVGSSVLGIVKEMLQQDAHLGMVQSVLLLALNVGIILFGIYKNKIKTMQISSLILIASIGFSLGIISSFLGIGGGPINIAVLYYFFSMQQKEAARNSLFMIFFAQLTSLLTSIFLHTVPNIELSYLLLMCIGGISGGVLGTKVSHKINGHQAEKIFWGIVIIIVLLNIYNIIKFSLVI